MPVVYTDRALPKRQDHDFYATPIEFCEAALRALPATIAPQFILDPGAGSGNWGKAAHKVYGGSADITGVDIRNVPRPPEYNSWINGKSFLDVNLILKRFKKLILQSLCLVVKPIQST